LYLKQLPLSVDAFQAKLVLRRCSIVEIMVATGAVVSANVNVNTFTVILGNRSYFPQRPLAAKPSVVVAKIIQKITSIVAVVVVLTICFDIMVSRNTNIIG
jgi:hypothetical protein